MRGHIGDMDAIAAVCLRHGMQLIEDCAHTIGAAWNGRPTGTWGRAGCFSLQSYKHANAGEGGLLVTDDEDVAAQAILFSGSCMLYRSHLAPPGRRRVRALEVRDAQLQPAHGQPASGNRAAATGLRTEGTLRALEPARPLAPHVLAPPRPQKERFVASSFQASLVEMSRDQRRRFIEAAAACGLHIKWFGADEPIGFTSAWTHWRYFGEPQPMPNAGKVLAGLCDLRLPLMLTQDSCVAIASVIRQAIVEACRR